MTTYNLFYNDNLYTNESLKLKWIIVKVKRIPLFIFCLGKRNKLINNNLLRKQNAKTESTFYFAVDPEQKDPFQ